MEELDVQGICIVTGSNKGIGLSVIRALCSKLNNTVVYLTSRNEELGRKAVNILKEEGLEVAYHQLDITDEKSIDQLHDYIKNNHHGIDILINNAGIAYKNDSTAPFSEQADITVATNFFGTRSLCNKLFPLLNKGARVVNVSSNCGHLSKINGEEPAARELREKLASDSLSEQQLVELMDEFVDLAKRGEHFKNGWPNSAYKVSKVGVSALSRIQQRSIDKERGEDDIVINHVHPGYVATDMSSHKGYISVEEGAKPIVMAATLPPQSKIKGEYIWEDGSITSWIEEQVNLFY